MNLTLSQDEYSALLKLARVGLRNANDQAYHILHQELYHQDYLQPDTNIHIFEIIQQRRVTTMKIPEPPTHIELCTDEQPRRQTVLDAQILSAYEPQISQPEPVAEDLGRHTATGSGEERPHKRTHIHFITPNCSASLDVAYYGYFSGNGRCI